MSRRLLIFLCPLTDVLDLNFLNTSFHDFESLLKSRACENFFFFFQLKVTEELEKVKQEMEEKGSSMTDGGEYTLILRGK